MKQLDNPNKLLQEHIHEFKRQGFTVFPQTFDETWMQRAREIFEETVNSNVPNNTNKIFFI